MKPVIAFFERFDDRAVRALLAGVAVLGLLAIGFSVGRTVIGGDGQAGVQEWLGAMRESGWGLPAAVLVFVVGAFLAVPQTILFGVTVLVFGFERGVAFAWMSTLVSATATYFVGRALGADALERFGGAAGRRITQFVGSNGLTSSCVIRLIPSAPFIVVNIALAAAGVRPLSFILGTALGIVPKLMIVGAIAGGVLQLSGGGDWRIAAGLAALAVAWIGVIALVRRRFGTSDQQNR